MALVARCSKQGLTFMKNCLPLVALAAVPQTSGLAAAQATVWEHGDVAPAMKSATAAARLLITTECIPPRKRLQGFDMLITLYPVMLHTSRSTCAASANLCKRQ